MTKMLFDGVLIREDVPRETYGKIIIPKGQRDRAQTGTVLAVGRGYNGEKMVIAVGDRVLYGEHGGSPVKIGGEMLLQHNQRWIWAVIGKDVKVGKTICL